MRSSVAAIGIIWCITCAGCALQGGLHVGARVGEDEPQLAWGAEVGADAAISLTPQWTLLAGLNAQGRSWTVRKAEASGIYWSLGGEVGVQRRVKRSPGALSWAVLLEGGGDVTVPGDDGYTGYTGLRVEMPIWLSRARDLTDRNRTFELVTAIGELAPFVRARVHIDGEMQAARGEIAVGLLVRFRIGSHVLPYLDP